MKKCFTLLSLFFCLLSFSSAQKELNLDEIWNSARFTAGGARGFTAMNDGETYVQIDTDKEKGLMELNRYRISDGEKTGSVVSNALLHGPDGTRISLSSFRWSGDEKKIMFLTEAEQIYRHSYISRFSVYDLATKEFYVHPEKVLYAEFSPDGSKVSYVKENNMFYLDLAAGKEHRITEEGIPNGIIYGAVDWVYEEEFSMSKGYEWSPDSRYLAFYRFDERHVREFSMDIYSGLYPARQQWKYPKAGEANSVVEVWVFEAASGSVRKLDTGADTDIYLPRIQWTKEPGVLSIQRLNRLQNHLEILFADVAAGEVKTVYEEKNAAYIDINDRLDFSAGSFIFTSEKDGFNHLYRFDYKKNKLNQLTSGSWDIDQYYGRDEEKSLLYFSAADESPARRNIWVLDLRKNKLRKLNEEQGWNTASFTKGYKYYLHVWSNAATPPSYMLRKADGTLLRSLQENGELKSVLKEYSLGAVEFGRLTTDSGISLDYYVVKPPDLDSSKKYPVLMYVYGGPGSQTVRDAWGGSYYLWFSYLASKGYVVVSVDNRGTGFRGEAFKKCTYLQLGKLEIEDQIAAARAIGSWSFADPGRIGIWGWSYGGYMASLGITKGADVFKTAVAVAPVTSWRYYDNIYTERFMRTPAENPAGYDDNSPIHHVSSIKGNYLIIHGTADDNVHFQNAVEMVNKMIEANVKFDSEFYPNKNHGIGGGNTRLHLFQRITDYLEKHL
jgi:dipeptidyl-peptidase-4